MPRNVNEIIKRVIYNWPSTQGWSHMVVKETKKAPLRDIVWKFMLILSLQISAHTMQEHDSTVHCSIAISWTPNALEHRGGVLLHISIWKRCSRVRAGNEVFSLRAVIVSACPHVASTVCPLVQYTGEFSVVAFHQYRTRRSGRRYLSIDGCWPSKRSHERGNWLLNVHHGCIGELWRYGTVLHLRIVSPRKTRAFCNKL